MELLILGCNSATPTSHRNPSAQILNISGHTFLIDCGEGTQFQMRKMHVNFMKIEAIFISHMHGDHMFGLIGLISTMSLLNRSTPLTIFGHPKLEEMLRPQIAFFCDNIPFKISFVGLRYDKPQVLQEVKHVNVRSIPLRHRVDTCGFVFREQVREPNIRREAICRYGLTIADIVSIKNGRPYYDYNGEEVAREELVREAPAPLSYAYISDTQYLPNVASEIEGVSLLFHEATFMSELSELAMKTMHSTARQAALIAKAAKVRKLIIGHFSSRYVETDGLEAEAQEIFPDTTAVYDGFKIVF